LEGVRRKKLCADVLRLLTRQAANPGSKLHPANYKVPPRTGQLRTPSQVSATKGTFRCSLWAEQRQLSVTETSDRRAVQCLILEAMSRYDASDNQQEGFKFPSSNAVQPTIGRVPPDNVGQATRGRGDGVLQPPRSCSVIAKSKSGGKELDASNATCADLAQSVSISSRNLALGKGTLHARRRTTTNNLEL
jgi:hypothetical protein